MTPVVCWSLTSLCHSNGHIETMPAREINPFTALTRIRSQFLRTQWSTSNHSEWTRLRLRPLSHRGWPNDPSDSEPTYLGSLGVLDLDLTVFPDVFGLRAFDEKMPITRMLPGSSPCDLRLLIPDAGIGQDGVHDVIIENLLGTSTWRSKYVSLM